jgi:FkbM family methyltransferase
MITTAGSKDGWHADRPLLLYGAGNLGRLAARNLMERGIKITAFLDASAIVGEKRQGIPVYTLADWLKFGRPEQFHVLVSIFNPDVDVVPIIEQLQAAGFARVLSVVDYIDLCPDGVKERMWLTPTNYYQGKELQLEAALSLFSDSLSRRWFEGALRVRRTGDWHALPKASVDDQYIPADLPRWSEPMRLIDCGAYDGDTIELLSSQYRIAAVAAFEPDADNYAKLVRRPREFESFFLPCGVSSSARLARFDAGQRVSSRIDALGETTIQCIGIDDVSPSFAPTLIKMDIEGAEPEALLGAQRTLRRYRPSLAISLYHKPDHLCEIPLWLAKLDLGYQMYLRGHRHCGYDLILYCRPD